MTTPARSHDAGHRFPAEIITHAIWAEITGANAVA